MNTASDNRDIEVRFEDLMPGYQCVVTRQEDGAINLQLESLTSHHMIVLPALEPTLWDSPEKLQSLCKQIAEEFAILCEESPPTDAPLTSYRMRDGLMEKLYTILDSMRGHV
ncbi:hypothetical protein Pres01_23880 [Metapseudomonas resinovorans]|uniref:hypothetical protein n=1 Tax=Metapseudomonas resinovorans TaxID=53412 RepID=UPI0009876553|nr:hypothetical protein [Pseudomonas resinovorans]GLZ86337.1 hypothetical protein Pres01_23880 [Pseudomonas resinovorans]